MKTRRFTKQVQGLNHINFEFLRSRRREKSAPAYLRLAQGCRFQVSERRAVISVATFGKRASGFESESEALARERTSIEVVSITGGDGDGIFEEGDD
jgi:hypothetical protein